jgi:ABC-2 type transport system permease protein
VVYGFVIYEIRRALARRKVLIFVAFTILLDTIPYYILSTSHLTMIPAADYPYLWVAGVFAPLTLFIQFIAIFIAAGAMSEEYEQGTAELLLSKPVSRTEYFVGKFLGGYFLLFCIVALNSLLSVIAATATFGNQSSLGIIPGVVLMEAYASLLFYSLAFMLGELIRRSSVSYIFSAAAYFASNLAGLYISIVSELTGTDTFRAVQMYIPTSPVSSLPLQYAASVLPSGAQRILQFVGGLSGVEPSTTFSALLIGAYFLASAGTALAYFRHFDVSKKVG